MELACRIAKEVPDTVIGDAGRIRQILVNLLGNSLKFTTQGEIIVNVGVREMTSESINLEFKIQDTGIGIERNKLSQIFDAFTQADGSTTRRYGGTGLGLTICQQFVKLMSGSIWVESEFGKGSTFGFTIVCGRSTCQPPAKKNAAMISLEGLRVLVVDDNATNRLILREMLDGWYMNPTVVEGGAPALSELERSCRINRPYDLVLLDAHMPDMDGFTVAKRIRERAEFLRVRLMMLTSMDHCNSAELCSQLGLSSYLTKPIRQSELLDAITTVQQLHHQGEETARFKEAPSEYRQPERALNILVAEDNLINQKVVKSVLERNGHQVTFANNGQEAVQAVFNAKYDVVLMDVQMPIMDGCDASIAIRKREAQVGGRVPIIALTAHAMQGDSDRCLALGWMLTSPSPFKSLLSCRRSPRSWTFRPPRARARSRQVAHPTLNP